MTFMDEHEIFDDLMLYKLPEDEKKRLKEMGEDDLISMHHGFGMWIRNTYKMWHETNPHFDHENARGDRFPDQVSQRIIEKIWCRLNDTYISTKMDFFEGEGGVTTMVQYYVDSEGNRVDSRPSDGKREATIPSFAELLRQHEEKRNEGVNAFGGD